MRELKPCPFCGSEDVLEQDTGINIPYLLCNDCHAQGPHSFSPALRWNFRAEQSELTTLREQVKVLREALEVACIDLLSNLENIGGFVGLAVINNGQTALDQTKPKDGE